MIETFYQKSQVFCKEVIDDFNKKVLGFFIAGLYGNLKNFKTPEEVAQTISKIKKSVKKNGGNNFIIVPIK